ncbi:hypothetical protein [Paracoccus spongiarum]|uniref:Uncharacterized protein n=1 Tax=Paracoccus spongiarum TaxID=3064387 RepID=A0ABT9JB23_9RHOB|nr:hypothetical protein [Paracoccus sp. 2205BS29-5]MDP5307003.1 hypothetical protein [Paracoccus sp. 2205BS29-5]
MGAAVELKYEWTDPNQDPRPARWTPPKAAYATYRPGLSPYLHYWQALRARRGEIEPPPELGETAGNDLPAQMQAALEELISRSFKS